jgi:hypothetical protein
MRICSRKRTAIITLQIVLFVDAQYSYHTENWNPIRFAENRTLIRLGNRKRVDVHFPLHICKTEFSVLIHKLYIFQLHLEASHVLKYTEKEFVDSLDWKPFSKQTEK